MVIFLAFDKFLTFLLILSLFIFTTLLLLGLIAFIELLIDTKTNNITFNIKLSSIAIVQNFLINCPSKIANLIKTHVSFTDYGAGQVYIVLIFFFSIFTFYIKTTKPKNKIST